MLNGINDLKLKNQLLLLLCATSIMIITVLIFYNSNIYEAQKQDNMESSYSYISKTDLLLSQTVSNISETAKTIVTNKYVQKYLILQNEASVDNLNNRLELLEMLDSYFSGIIGSNNIILDIVLVDNHEIIHSQSNVFEYNVYDYLKNKYNLIADKNGFLTSMIDYLGNNYYTGGFAYVIPVYHTTGLFHESNQLLGICIIWCHQNTFINIVKSTVLTENSVAAVIDDLDKIVAQRSPLSMEELSANLEKVWEQYDSSRQGEIQEISFNRENCYVIIKTNELTKWKSINITPADDIFKDARDVFYHGIIIASFAIIIVLIIGILIIKSITKPLATITSTLKTIGEGRHDLRIAVTGSKEFRLISASVNNMLDNINRMNNRILEMQRKLYKAEINQKESEMQVLQSQINPHFLYNTFECIRSIAVVRKIKEISIISSSMANIFRYSIKGSTFTTVENELGCINDYHKIISIRYDGRVRMGINVPDELYKYKILKLSLQPIVEYLTNYCLEMTENMIDIGFDGYKTDEKIIFIISEAGIEMDGRKIISIKQNLNEAVGEYFTAQNKDKDAVVLNNINARLKLHYGDNYGLKVENMTEKGILITVTMPADL